MSIRKASLNDDNNVISHTFQRCVGCNSVMVRFANQQTDFRKKSEKYSKTTQGRGSQLLHNKCRTAQSNKPCQLAPSTSRLAADETYNEHDICSGELNACTTVCTSDRANT